MRLFGNGRVWIDSGEIFPVFCECGHIYQPEESSTHSQCPVCLVLNDHEDMRGEPVPLEGMQATFQPND